MALQKQTVSVNFSQGLDTKTDPNQIAIGKFQALENSVFDKLARLTKRNGFGYLPPLPDGSSTFLTTFNGSLTALGHDLKAFASGPELWTPKGSFVPLQVSTLPLIRNNLNQSYADTATSNNGLLCTVYTDNMTSGSTTIPVQKYAICDLNTGQFLINPTPIISSFGTVSFAPKVFTLGSRFIVMFTALNGASARLQYFPISVMNPQMIGSVSELSSTITPSLSGAWDGVVTNNNLVVSWAANLSGGVKSAFLTSSLQQSNETTIASSGATLMSVTADNTLSSPVIWNSFYLTGSSNAGYTVATTLNSGSGSFNGISTVFPAVRTTASGSAIVLNIASSAQNGVLNLVYENNNKYSYTAASTSFLTNLSVFSTGSLSTTAVLSRSLGLASKGFLVNSVSYYLGTFGSQYQPTYFLLGSAGAVVAKLAYQNGGGYLGTGLPSVQVTGSTTASFAYLFKDLVQAVNKDTNVATGTQVNGIYAQTGVNYASVNFGTSGIFTTETANSLNINGGYLSMYDGQQIVEQGFHVYPEPVVVSISSTSGGLQSQTYFYQSTYEWADNAGLIHRSAPSIPVSVTIATASQTAAVVNIPTLRLTSKVSNPVKLVIYRWSTAQQIYYQVTSIVAPILNDKTIDSIAYTDTASDASILGNNIIYTNGGVIENIAAPATAEMTLFDSRLWLIDAEDRNLLWFSKQVIEATPVEMSDLLTLFVPPSSGAQGPTGPMTCLAPMDDKLIIFKKNAIYYINGIGPDNTGANNQYSQPIFITSTIGCSNQDSIVMTPNGLMFQSDKGIWLLGRDLSTSYIGKDVEIYNSNIVLSSLAAPATNQVRFTLNNNVILMYDYFVNQWGTFNGTNGISSTLYQGMHTFINANGQVFQETPNLYLDGASPVLMSFTTGWLNLAGLQGYQRIYRMYLLGNYQTPHKLSIGIAYDYDINVSQVVAISPDNYSPAWGGDANWGSGVFWGGPSQVEQWQINFETQSCETFQINFDEFYDPSKGVAAGAGLTVSGINLVFGQVKGFPRNLGADHQKG